jgi:MFS family permease
MADAVDVAEEIAAAPFGRFHLLLGLLIGLVLFFDGYDLFNGAYVAPYVRAEWSLEPVQLGVLLSAGICGLAVGSLSVGYFAPRCYAHSGWSPSPALSWPSSCTHSCRS